MVTVANGLFRTGFVFSVQGNVSNVNVSLLLQIIYRSYVLTSALLFVQMTSE